MEKKAKIYIAGHRGLVGSAIVRKLESEGFQNLIVKAHNELDLTSQADTLNFFQREKPDYVFLSAARVGGIHANNTYPADFFYQNMMIAANCIHAAYLTEIKKLLFLGSSCIYPRLAPQPIKEEYLLTGSLEPTNEAYAIAKIAGLEMCKYYKRQYGVSFISAMPTNLYGINDNFDLNNSHVLPALIRKFHEAKLNNEATVTIWGTGKPKREFLFVDDLADALLFLMKNYDDESHVNIGTGTDQTILELAQLIAKVVGYQGQIIHDLSKPDGTPQKLMDNSKLTQLGWRFKTTLEEGLTKTYQWYQTIQK